LYLLTLNSQLYLGIFLKCYLTVLSVIYTCVFWNVRKFLFCIFPFAFQLLVWSFQTDMFLCPDALDFVDLLSDSMPSGRVCTTSGHELFSFSDKHIYYFLPVLSCCAVCVFSRTDPEILAFSAHLLSFPCISFDFPYSLELWLFLEYWNL
jgi:hypothetical protein